MADNIHTTLAAFRDTMLTAIARLEFQLRDSMTGRDIYERSTILSDIHIPDTTKYEVNIHELFKRVDSLERRITEQQHPILEHDFMEIRPALHTRNILVPSVRSTPALAAAVAAASALPPELDLKSETSSESEEEDIIEEESVQEDIVKDIVLEEEAVKEEAVKEETVKEEAVKEEKFVEGAEYSEEETEETEEEPELKPIKIKRVQYYIDPENNLYSETEDGYEQVGVYNPETKTIKPIEDEEESEGAVEVEDFVYKNTTYQRDADNNVYLNGDQIGTWNGKKIIPS
jgi:hypothetical protein